MERCIESRAVALAEQYDELYAAVALQPNDLSEDWHDDFAAVRSLASHPKVVAIGESGVDDYWKTIPMDRQQAAFTAHLELAQAVNKPIVIHCRDAEQYAIATLRSFLSDHANHPNRLQGLMHSYTGSTDAVREFLAIGFYVSFAGMITFKKSEPLRETSDVVPLDRLLIETDCPWLTPEPMRKQRRNEPALVFIPVRCSLIGVAFLIRPSRSRFAPTRKPCSGGHD